MAAWLVAVDEMVDLAVVAAAAVAGPVVMAVAIVVEVAEGH